MSHQAGPSQAKPGQSIREIGETNWQLHSLKAENPAWSAGDSHTPDKQGPALDLREAAQPLPLFILFRHFVLGPVHSTPISCRLIFQGPVRSFQKHSLCIFFLSNGWTPTATCYVPHPPQAGFFFSQHRLGVKKSN